MLKFVRDVLVLLLLLLLLLLGNYAVLIDFVVFALRSVFVYLCWQEVMYRFREAFQGKYSELVKTIDVDNGLWTELQTLNVLTERQIRSCKSMVCHY